MDHVIHLADCLGPEGLSTLADKSVDHVICDPPYEAEAHALSRKAAVPGRDGHRGVTEIMIPFAAITEEARADVSSQIVRVTSGWALIFAQVEGIQPWRRALESAGASWRRAAVWIKPDCSPQFTGDRPAQGYEQIVMVWCGEGRSRWNGGGKRGVYEALTKEDRCVHPTQKPLSLMETLLRDFTNPGDLVCDPYSGSGTTGVAAKRLGRRFLGWERDPKYHAIAEKRISSAREQFSLLEPRGPEPKQAALPGALGAGEGRRGLEHISAPIGRVLAGLKTKVGE